MVLKSRRQEVGSSREPILQSASPKKDKEKLENRWLKHASYSSYYIQGWDTVTAYILSQFLSMVHCSTNNKSS